MCSRLLHVARGISSKWRAGVSRHIHGDRDVEKYFNFTGVIVGSVTDSLVGGALRLEQPTEPVDIVKTRQQHSYYVEQMKEVVNGNVVQVCVLDNSINCV